VTSLIATMDFQKIPHVNLFTTNETELHLCFTRGPKKQFPENCFQKALVDLSDQVTFRITVELKDDTGLLKSYDMEIRDLEKKDCPFHYTISKEAKKFNWMEFRLSNSNESVGTFDVDFNTLSTSEDIEYGKKSKHCSDCNVCHRTGKFYTKKKMDVVIEPGVPDRQVVDFKLEAGDRELSLADDEEDYFTSGVLSEPSSDEDTDSNLSLTDDINTADDIGTAYFTPGVLSEPSSDEDTDSILFEDFGLCFTSAYVHIFG